MTKVAELGMVSTLVSGFTLVFLLIVCLNLLGSIVSGVWLAFLGEWWALGYGLALLLASTLGVSFALLPSILLAAPGVYFLSRGPRFLAYPFAFLSNVYTAAVVTGWCVWVLQLYLQHAARRSFLPLLLWSYSAATGPWTYLASKDRDNPASMITATAAQLGYIVMMVMTFFFSPTLRDEAVAFGIVMGLALIVQFAVRRYPHAA
jgi:hypothetical protein